MRTVTTSAQAAMSSGRVALAVLVEIGTTPPVRLNSSAFGIDYGGSTFSGAGSLGAVDPIEEASASANSLRFTLSGLPSENLALALQEDVRGKAVKAILAVLDADSYTLLDTPIAYAGKVDRMTINFESSTATIGVNVIHKGVDFRRMKPLRYTEGDQRLISSNDTSLRYIQAQSQVQDVWPEASFFRQ